MKINGRDKKVLLRERKRHTARRVAIAISCYSGGGGLPWQKKISQSEHVSSQIWCQKIFLYWGGGPSTKIFFLVLTCIKSNLVSKNFPLLGEGGPSTKNFFPVWTCIKPNLVSEIFPLGGLALDKNFFSSLSMYQAKSGVKNFFPLLGGGSLDKNFFSGLNMYQAKSGVKKFSLYWGGGWPLTKIFFPVWTCIKPNLVSKNFPFTGEGGSPQQKFFFQSEHVSSQIWCQKFFP